MSSNDNLVRAITIYGGIPLLICGMTGNLLNFGVLWHTRHNSCAFLFLCLSVVNCFALALGLFTRILNVGYGLDWLQTNSIWCKIRISFTEASFLISLSCLSLASLDRCLASHREIKYRRLSQLSTARWAMSIACLLWVCHSIPLLVDTQSVPTPTGFICALITSDAYNKYRLYFSLLAYLGILPTMILIITGLVTYRNVNQLHLDHQREHAQRQLTSMMLIQIPIILISMIPYVAFTEYRGLTATYMKSTAQKAIENLVMNVVTLIFYVTFSCQFLVFFFSSPKFRRQLKAMISCQRVSQIVPDGSGRMTTQK